MKKSNWIDKYLHTNYIGCVAGNYSKGCRLYFKDINNFIQNVGKYADIEIIRVEDGDTLLNTASIYINRIWPDISDTMRSSTETMNDINYIALKFEEMRRKDGDCPKPLPKVTKFMKEVFGQEVVNSKEEYLEEFNEEQLEEKQSLKLQM